MLPATKHLMPDVIGFSGSSKLSDRMFFKIDNIYVASKQSQSLEVDLKELAFSNEGLLCCSGDYLARILNERKHPKRETPC